MGILQSQKQPVKSRKQNKEKFALKNVIETIPNAESIVIKHLRAIRIIRGIMPLIGSKTVNFCSKTAVITIQGSGYQCLATVIGQSICIVVTTFWWSDFFKTFSVKPSKTKYLVNNITYIINIFLFYLQMANVTVIRTETQHSLFFGYLKSIAGSGVQIEW